MPPRRVGWPLDEHLCYSPWASHCTPTPEPLLLLPHTLCSQEYTAENVPPRISLKRQCSTVFSKPVPPRPLTHSGAVKQLPLTVHLPGHHSPLPTGSSCHWKNVLAVSPALPSVLLPTTLPLLLLATCLYLLPQLPAPHSICYPLRSSLRPLYSHDPTVPQAGL